MAYKARKTKLKHLLHIMLITAGMAVGGQILFSAPGQVHADNGEESQITKERLDKLYEDSVTAQLAGEKESTAFAEKHLHDEFESVMHSAFNLEGAPPQKETKVFTKFEYLRDIKKAYEVSTIEEVKSGIVSYDIAADGRSAEVKDRTYTVASIPMPAEKGKSQLYSLRQFINCDNLYVLSVGDVLLLKSSSCNVEGQLSKAQ